MQVILLPEVLQYFENLVIILYEKGYFGFEETALKYVTELYDNIIMNLPAKLHKPAPKYFDKYGKDMEYAIFKKNKHTSWYVFFRVYQTNEENIYQVRYIANNHTIAQYF
jgi:hypothetical protein